MQRHAWHLFDSHLGSPQKITSASDSIIWDPVLRPFGSVATASGALEANIRFPGQYYDGEAGFHQNWHREYDPLTGRYIESDPIGLLGGINTYGYVGGRPLTAIDPMGLATLGDADQSLKDRGAPKERNSGLSAQYSDTQVFNEWLKIEGLDRKWLGQLKRCPRKIDICEGEPQNPNADDWKKPGPSNPEHKPGVFEMRSHKTSGGNANQCVYDADGNIMLGIPAAGSADYASHEYTNLNHTRHDLLPWLLAKRLDRREDYYKARPIWTE